MSGISPAVSKWLTTDLHMYSLMILCTIVDIYRQFGDITLAMDVTAIKLHQAEWMPVPKQAELGRRSITPQTNGFDVADAFEPFELNLASTFACIVMLESRHVKIADPAFQSVMAVSSGDSLYIAKSILTDPAENMKSRITRLRGNIGRAGIALLLPPDEPQIRRIDAGDWRFLNHDKYDGTRADSFEDTSLHASFTGFMLPFDTGSRGMRDIDVYFLETVISVRDKARWIGDLKPLPIFSNPSFRVIHGDNPTCEHMQKDYVAFEQKLTSTDSWYDFSTRPEGPIVFRANDNWMARLAAASMSIQQGHLTLVFGHNACWTCARIERQRLAHVAKPILIL